LNVSPGFQEIESKVSLDLNLHGGVMKKGDEVQSQDNTATAAGSQGATQFDANSTGAQLQSEARTSAE
jgi:hypothetical protein